MGDRVAHQRGLGSRAIAWAVGAALPLALNIPPARADSGAVDGLAVVCPDLSEAIAAELEARARATLLTSDLSATVTITCVGEAVAVQVEVGDDSVTLKVRVAPATLREEVLRALDRALADLGARVTPELRTATPAPAFAGTATESGAPLGPDAAETEAPLPSSATQPAAPTQPTKTETEIGAEVVGESWSDRIALGGRLRAAVRFDSRWSCGLRAGALLPLRVREATVLEAHALLEAAVTVHALVGLRFGVGAGPSLLFASPASGFVAPSATFKSALRIEAQVGRPFRWQSAELTPWVGARTFTAERGLRVADQTRLVLGSVQPQFGLTLALIR